jgi:hypothetical protein
MVICSRHLSIWGGSVVDYLHESGVSIYRRRRRQRAVITLTCVILLLFGTVVYAASYVQGWVGDTTPKAAANASCASDPALRPSRVTINVYNASNRTGLAAAVARSLERQGFKVATVDNDPLGKTLLGVGEIRTGQSGAAGAVLVAKRLAGARIMQDDRPDASVDLVLGKKFRALRVPPKAKTYVLAGVRPTGC